MKQLRLNKIDFLSTLNVLTPLSSMAAIFRNTVFAYSKFNSLKFNVLPRPKLTPSEGYEFHQVDMRIPMTEQDPNNAYSNIPTGESFLLRDVNFAAYDEDLHRKYIQYFTYGDYADADIFEGTFRAEMFKVQFVESKITDTTFPDDMSADSLIFQSSSIENCLFTGVSFKKNVLRNTMFRGCIFHKCCFYECDFSANFVDCRFEDALFRDCVLTSRIMKSAVKARFEFCIMNRRLLSGCDDTGSESFLNRFDGSPECISPKEFKMMFWE